IVLAEVAGKLEEQYGWKKKNIVKNLKMILNTPNLKFRGKEMLYRVINDYEENTLDFIDAYHGQVIKTTGTNKIYTYRTEVERCPGIKRVEP
ncbi:MAG: hypothetical protein KAS39_07620, partial [Actinomycetia bacterium]|nr:hypothetical protein [Actinomycetes bacterium]